MSIDPNTYPSPQLRMNNIGKIRELIAFEAGEKRSNLSSIHENSLATSLDLLNHT